MRGLVTVTGRMQRADRQCLAYRALPCTPGSRGRAGGGGQQGLTGSLLRGLLHELPWLVESWQEFHFMNLKINHSFINKEILLPRIKSEMTRTKRVEQKQSFSLLGKESSSEA